jgi:phage terminase large subunit
MEYDKETNHGLYLHTWLGQLRPYGERPAFGDGQLVWDGTEGGEPDIYGMDLSYSGNNVLVGISMQSGERELVIESARGKSGIPLQKLGDWVGEVSKAIVVDSARPEVIRLLRDQGFAVRKAEKGAGSVIGGIDRLNRFKSIVFKQGTEAAYDEFSKLGFNDKEELVGTRDFCDATRYGLEKIKPFRVISWDKLGGRSA